MIWIYENIKVKSGAIIHKPIRITMQEEQEMKDFAIEDGFLQYTGPKSGDVVIPDEITEWIGHPVFADIMEGPFTLTLSAHLSCSASDLLAQEVVAINIPAGATVEIKGGDFNSHTGDAFFKQLKEVNVSSEHPTLSSENGILYNKEKTILYSCPRAISGCVTIPVTVTEISAKAFYGCADITEVIIPDGVTRINERTFADCKSLKRIVLPDGVTEIGDEAFLRCAKITTAGYKGLGGKKGFNYEFSWTEKIPGNAFNGIKSLKKVVLPETIKEIGKNAFKACASLTEINLPADVKCDKKTFKDCKKLSI